MPGSLGLSLVGGGEAPLDTSDLKPAAALHGNPQEVWLGALLSVASQHLETPNSRSGRGRTNLLRAAHVGLNQLFQLCFGDFLPGVLVGPGLLRTIPGPDAQNLSGEPSQLRHELFGAIYLDVRTLNFLPTNGFSLKPPKITFSRGADFATE